MERAFHSGQEKRERIGTHRAEEGKGRQKMEPSSQLDAGKNGRQVDIRLLGRLKTVNLQGYQPKSRGREH